jgi:outer membrane protein OmpA-like peptidoglycan-associated protein
VVTREYFGVDLGVTVHPIEVRDGVAALSIEYQVPADAGDVPPIILMTSGAEDPAPSGGTGVRLVDGDQVIPVALAGDKFAALGEPYTPEPGGTVSTVALFAAPRGESVGVLIPTLGFVADVPVVDAGSVFDDVVAQVGEATDTPAFGLRTFFATSDDVTASAEADTVTVTLHSDVLFASSEYVLSADADAALQDAAAQIEASAPGGAITVIGHTDDVDTDEFNQTLSEQRASSVADRLHGLLGDSYTISAVGRGESEPVADGTSEEARAANRRVEITFTGDLPVEAEQAGEVPSTDAPTSSGFDPVAYKHPHADESFTAQVVEMTRTDTGIVGTLRLTVDPAGTAPVEFFGDTQAGNAAGRGFGLVKRLGGVHELSLLTSEKRVMPFDYEVPATGASTATRRVLGDEAIGMGVPDGAGVLLTAIWPDTGQDAVTIDVPGWFRITDVPVTTAD